jgi:hypothetical protein
MSGMFHPRGEFVSILVVPDVMFAIMQAENNLYVARFADENELHTRPLRGCFQAAFFPLPMDKIAETRFAGYDTIKSGLT